MKRKITGFKLDNQGDWTAILSCGHPQHVRHRPPFELRPWVISEEGRSSKIGEALNCLRCENFEMPDGLVSFKKTDVFDEVSIPAGMKISHSTKDGVWGKIEILKGKLIYNTTEPSAVIELSPAQYGVIVPGQTHFIQPQGQVRFYIEFFRVAEL